MKEETTDSGDSKEKSALESLNEKLYKRDFNPESDVSSGLKKNTTNINKDWEGGSEKKDKSKFQKFFDNEQQSNLSEGEVNKKEMKKKKIMKIFIWSAVLFFILSIAIAFFVFFAGLNQVSSENIIITSNGSVSTPAGKVYDYTLNIRNKNNVSLKNTTLTINYPEGSRNANDPTEDLRRDIVRVGDVMSGDNKNINQSVILYGNKDDVKIINLEYEYNVPGSNSAFRKTKDIEITIGESPVTLKINMGNEFTSGQDIEAEINILSNSDKTVRDVLLVAEYPFGFDFISADLEPTYGDNVWQLGSIAPTESRTIKIKGKVIGTANDERTIRFNLGIRDSARFSDIGPLISTTEHTYGIESPFLGVTMRLNGMESSRVVTNMGQKISGTVLFTNNLDRSIENGSVELYIPNGIVEDSTIKISDGGFFRSTDRRVVWNKNNNNKLSSISPGETLSFGFELETISPFSNAATVIRNPELIFETLASGNTSSERADNGYIENKILNKVLINSRLSLASRATYSIGPFSNSGPIPPQVNQKTTYTIEWALSNSYNDLTGVYVIATLPEYVEWQGEFYPSSGSVSYDPDNRTVRWDVGRMGAGVGYGRSPIETAFKIGLVPSTTQVNSEPIIISTQKVYGLDEFTDSDLNTSKASLNTKITNDPIYNQNIGKVIE